jgi:hypothetical protein
MIIKVKQSTIQRYQRHGLLKYQTKISTLGSNIILYKDINVKVEHYTIQRYHVPLRKK